MDKRRESIQVERRKDSKKKEENRIEAKKSIRRTETNLVTENTKEDKKKDARNERVQENKVNEESSNEKKSIGNKNEKKEEKTINFNKLRKQLNNVNYKESLCESCAPLVYKIFNDLIKAVDSFQKLSNKYEDLEKNHNELKNQQKKKDSEGKENNAKEGKKKIENELFLSNEEEVMHSKLEEYESKISKLNYKLKEEKEQKEALLMENKKLKFSLDIVKNTKKEEEEEERMECKKKEDWRSSVNRSKSFDDFEVTQLKKTKIKRKKKQEKENGVENKGEEDEEAYNNEEEIHALTKDLHYYKKMCKDLTIEIERIKHESSNEKSNPRKDPNELSQVEAAEEEIRNLRKRLNEYEMEIRKLNELRMMNDIEQEMVNKENLKKLKNTKEESEYSDGIDDISTAERTKQTESVEDKNNLQNLLRAKNNEILHLKNRVLLLETEMQIKNDKENKRKEQLRKEGGLEAMIYDSFASSAYSEEPSHDSVKEIKDSDTPMRKKEIEEMKEVIQKLEAELVEERKKIEKLEKKYSEEKNECAILKEELKNLEQEIEQKESEFHLNKDTIHNLKMESDEINNILSCSNETKKQLTSYIQNLLEKLNECNNKIDELKDTNILQKKKMEHYEKEIKKLKNDLVDSNNQLDEFATLLDKKDETIESYKNKLENINNEYGELSVNYNSLLKENKNLQITNSSYNANTSLMIQQLQQEIQILNINNSHLKKIEEDYKIVLQEKTIIEEAAIKIQTELKKSVDKIKSLETYIQTLSVEINNLRTQRDDSLDALTKIAIEKTQYENEVVQSKNMIHELQKKLQEYESSMKIVQNNVSEINIMHIKAEEEQTIMKQQIKTLREQLNEKTIQLQLLQEKEKNYNDNLSMYNDFHLEAQKKYHTYEKTIEDLKKEVGELSIHNQDNIVIIHRLKEELKELHEERTKQLSYILKTPVEATTTQLISKEEILMEEGTTKESTRNMLEPSIPKKEDEIIKEAPTKERISKEEEFLHYDDEDFVIFKNKKGYKNKLDSSIKNISPVSSKHEEWGNHVNYKKEYITTSKEKMRPETNGSVRSTTRYSTTPMETNTSSNGMIATSIKNHDEIHAVTSIKTENHIPSESIPVEYIFSHDNKKEEERETESKQKDDDHNVEESVKESTSVSEINDLSLSSLENINHKGEPIPIDSLSSVNTSSCMDHNDISLFNSSKIKKIFNLSSTQKDEKNKKENSKYINDGAPMREPENDQTDETNQTDSYENLIFTNNHNNKKSLYENRNSKERGTNKKYETMDDSTNLLTSRSLVKKELKKRLGSSMLSSDDEDEFNLYNVTTTRVKDAVTKKNQEGRASTSSILNLSKPESIPLSLDKKKTMKKEESSNKKTARTSNGLKTIESKKDLREISYSTFMNSSKNEKTKKNNGYSLVNNSTDRNKSKKNFNFISQTSYEANSNTSSVLLDSVSSDFGPHVSIDQGRSIDKSISFRKPSLMNSSSKNVEIEYSLLSSSNNSSIVPLEKRRSFSSVREANSTNGRRDYQEKSLRDSSYNGYEKKRNTEYVQNGNTSKNRNMLELNESNYEKINDKERKSIHLNESTISNKNDTHPNKSKIKKDLFDKYMNVLKSLQSEEMDASMNTTNNKTIDLTNDLHRFSENLLSSNPSSIKTLYKDSLLSNLAKFKSNEEYDEYGYDPVNIVEPFKDQK